MKPAGIHSYADDAETDPAVVTVPIAVSDPSMRRSMRARAEQPADCRSLRLLPLDGGRMIRYRAD